MTNALHALSCLHSARNINTRVNSSFQECSKEKTEPNALWHAHIQGKGVKELPTDSPYKPCFNKPLPPPRLPLTPFDSPNPGKISIYGPVPVLDCCSQASSAALSLHSVSPSLFRSFHASIGGSLDFHGYRALCASPIQGGIISATS